MINDGFEDDKEEDDDDDDLDSEEASQVMHEPEIQRIFWINVDQMAEIQILNIIIIIIIKEIAIQIYEHENGRKRQEIYQPMLIMNLIRSIIIINIHANVIYKDSPILRINR